MQRRLTEAGEEMFWVCDVGAESMKQSQLDLPLSHRDSTFHPGEEEQSSVEQVTVKQEKPEEETDGSTHCLDSLKMEDLSANCSLAVQSQMLEEWKPEVAGSETQDSETPLFHTAKGRGKKEYLNELQNVFRIPSIRTELDI